MHYDNNNSNMVRIKKKQYLQLVHELRRRVLLQPRPPWSWPRCVCVCVCVCVLYLEHCKATGRCALKVFQPKP